MLEAAPDAILVINRVGEVLAANLRAEKLYGYSREQLIGMVVESLIPARLRDRHRQHREHFLADPDAQGMRVLEIFALRGDGSEIPVDVSLSHLILESDSFAISAIRDATELRRAEELKRTGTVLRESEERFRLMADTAPALIWMSNKETLRNYFNRPWLEFTGRSLDSELGNGWAEGVHPEDSQRCLALYSQSVDRQEKFRMEYRLRRYDGEYRWILDTGVPRFSQDSSFVGYIGIGVDVTDRKRAEEGLSTVSRKLIEAQEQERTRIARELHDDTSQRLALLAIEIGQLKKDVPHTDEVLSRLDELRKTTSEIATDIQALSHELHSSKLEYLGLVAAMRSFYKEFGKQQTVEVEFEYHDMPSSVPPDISLCLFRVLQEALHNAAKHSGVRHFRVQLRGTLGEIHLTVSDAGAGFDPQEAVKGHGLGLTSMKERLHLVRGELSIDSAPKCGTTIHARVPLSSDGDSMRAAG